MRGLLQEVGRLFSSPRRFFSAFVIALPRSTSVRFIFCGGSARTQEPPTFARLAKRRPAERIPGSCSEHDSLLVPLRSDPRVKLDPVMPRLTQLRVASTRLATSLPQYTLVGVVLEIIIAIIDARLRVSRSAKLLVPIYPSDLIPFCTPFNLQVYFGKTKDVVYDLRSVEDLERTRRQRDLQKELVGFIKR